MDAQDGNSPVQPSPRKSEDGRVNGSQSRLRSFLTRGSNQSHVSKKGQSSKISFPASFKHGSNQLPPTAIGASGSAMRHWHIYLLLTITQTLTIVGLVRELSADASTTTIGMSASMMTHCELAARYTNLYTASKMTWKNSTTAAISAFSTYFGSDTQPIWQAMADAGQPPLPWNLTLQLGLQQPANQTAALHLFGPDLARYARTQSGLVVVVCGASMAHYVHAYMRTQGAQRLQCVLRRRGNPTGRRATWRAGCYRDLSRAATRHQQQPLLLLGDRGVCCGSSCQS